ncbi:MAG: hypothetical protein M2R45_04292 [Verrucomicrobia subdivision 3 bacterium]|nr:hypothetical protein [Limisphaerales bacterium]
MTNNGDGTVTITFNGTLSGSETVDGTYLLIPETASRSVYNEMRQSAHSATLLDNRWLITTTGTFTEVGQKWGFAHHGVSAWYALGDLGNDGGLDVVVNHLNGPLRLYRNGSGRPRIAPFACTVARLTLLESVCESPLVGVRWFKAKR